MATRTTESTDSTATAAAGIRIRMYRVGFGDFFLMSVPAADGTMAHILVDCGVHAHDLGVIGGAVEQMKADTGGKLALVIMTHRHADHISGFASASDVFQTFAVERVWMSWFEDPKDKQALKIQAGIAATAAHLQAALALRAAPGDDEYLRMAGNALGVSKGGGNAGALVMLHGFKTAEGGPTPVDYYAAGDTPTLPASLAAAGLEADILGPPRDLNLVAQMDNAAHQYLTSGAANDDGPAELFSPAYAVRSFPWPKDDQPIFTPQEIENRVIASQPDALAAAAQKADNALNNQSVVVLFTFRDKTLLFSGDAQWGNWANFLFGGAIGTPGHTDLTDRSRQVLGNLDFYKVGHHGSTNATPMDVVKAMKAGCVAMCSTDPGAYGNPLKGTEVPRTPLLAALTAKTGNQLARSDQVPVGSVPATAGLAAVAAPFKSETPGTIDYWI
ncbi:MAG: putative metallo-hydrolase [Alphaproteobacteria bacterium]|nr:putative metallo-hydrolase [Alphaproteobacteria bacterium]